MAYGKTKDLAKRTQSDKVLRDKAFKIASDPKYDGYQRGLASMVYKFFDKRSSGSGVANEPNYQLANELHTPIIRKLKIRKIYSSYRDNIWGIDLADMQYGGANITNESSIYCVQLIYLVNMHGLFH